MVRLNIVRIIREVDDDDIANSILNLYTEGMRCTYGFRCIRDVLMAIIGNDHLDFEVITTLIEHSNDYHLTCRDSRDNNILIPAMKHPSLFKYLTDNLSLNDLIRKNIYGNTALHIAIKNKNLECTKILMSKIKLENKIIKNLSGNTPLHLAINTFNSEAIEILLLEYNSDHLAIQNASGDTALHLAVRTRNTKCINALLDVLNPEDIAIQNSFGNTPLHLAAEMTNAQCIIGIIQKMNRSDVHIKNKLGKTAMDMASNSELSCAFNFRSKSACV